MINSIKPLGGVVNEKREREKKYKAVKKEQNFEKYLEKLVPDSDGEKLKNC